MKKARQIWVFLLSLLVCTALITETAWATFSLVACDSATGSITGTFDPKTTGFFDPENISANSCADTWSSDKTTVDNVAHKVFSNITCNFVLILNDVFSKFYCSIQYAMKEVLFAVLVIYIAVFGARMLIGTQEVNSGTVIMALLKIGIIMEIAENGALGIGMIYNFFTGLVIETVDWVYGAIKLCDPHCFSGDDLSEFASTIDDKIYAIFMGSKDSTGADLNNGIFTGKGELIALFFILAILVPPLFEAVLWLTRTTFMIFARSIASFLMCITAVAFLISLSPIFLSFALFNSTVRIFDSWLRFMISYSLQPMFIFGMLGLWLMIISDSVTFISQLTSVMRFELDDRHRGANVREIENELKFCKLAYSDSNPISDLHIDISSSPVKYVPGGPQIGCCRLTGGPVYECDNTGDTVKITDIPDEQLVSYSVMVADNQFIYFLAYHILSLLIIAYAFFQMIQMAPMIAQQLAGARMIAPPLGAGFGGGGGGFSSIVHQLSSRGSGAVRSAAARAVDKVAPEAARRINQFAPGAASGTRR